MKSDDHNARGYDCKGRFGWLRRKVDQVISRESQAYGGICEI